VTIWNAAFARLFLKKVLTTGQWFAIFVVFAGLVIVEIGAHSDGSRALLGAGMVAVGSIGHALSHVLSEALSSSQGSRAVIIPAQINCCIQGLTACFLVGLWQCTYTVSHLEKLVEPARDAGTTLPHALRLMTGLAVGNFIHAGTFFHLLTNIGAVSLGVLKGVQAASRAAAVAAKKRDAKTDC